MTTGEWSRIRVQPKGKFKQWAGNILWIYIRSHRFRVSLVTRETAMVFARGFLPLVCLMCNKRPAMQDGILSTVTFSSKVNLYYGLFPVILHNRLWYLSRPESEREYLGRWAIFENETENTYKGCFKGRIVEIINALFPFCAFTQFLHDTFWKC